MWGKLWVTSVQFSMKFPTNEVRQQLPKPGTETGRKQIEANNQRSRRFRESHRAPLCLRFTPPLRASVSCLPFLRAASSVPLPAAEQFIPQVKRKVSRPVTSFVRRRHVSVPRFGLLFRSLVFVSAPRVRETVLFRCLLDHSRPFSLLQHLPPSAIFCHLLPLSPTTPVLRSIWRRIRADQRRQARIL